MLEPEATPPALSFVELPVNNSREAIIENIRANVGRALPQLKQQPRTEKPLAIVGGGPSLHGYLPLLKQVRSGCHILSVNGAYKFLRSVGVESDHFILIDSRRDNIVHVDSPHPDTVHYLASQVHPVVFDALADYPVTMFHLATETGLEATKDLPPPQTYSQAPIGMASVHAIYIAAALGYRRLMLFGYDFSHKAGETYAFEQHMNAKDDAFTVTLNGQEFRTTLALARTAEQFTRAIRPIIERCELDIRLFSKGLLPEIIKASSAPHTEESERAKYEQMWRVPAYRIVSGGMRQVEEARDFLKIPSGASVADFGCGLGRCVKWFASQGFDAVGVDIAGNSLEEPVPFVQAALWDAEKLPRVQYGFSADVLEHIPPEKVEATLKAIHGACEVGCYLYIDTVPDAFGVYVGKELHLTVKPAEWWEERIRALWPSVESYTHKDGRAVFVCRK